MIRCQSTVIWAYSRTQPPRWKSLQSGPSVWLARTASLPTFTLYVPTPPHIGLNTKPSDSAPPKHRTRDVCRVIRMLFAAHCISAILRRGYDRIFLHHEYRDRVSADRRWVAPAAAAERQRDDDARCNLSSALIRLLQLVHVYAGRYARRGRLQVSVHVNSIIISLRSHLRLGARCIGLRSSTDESGDVAGSRLLRHRRYLKQLRDALRCRCVGFLLGCVHRHQ